MKLVIFGVLIVGTLGAPSFQSLSVNEDGTYQFSYETGSEGGNHFRTESKGPDGTVIGKYSYSDPTGGIRVVNYRADGTGFLSSEDGEIPKPSASEQDKVPAPEVPEKPEDSEKENQKEETISPPATETPVQDDDEEKPLKLEEPIKDLPPEGFPPGFFSGQFSALRRLPDPPKEETETKEKDDGKTDEPTTEKPANAENEPKGFFSASWQPEALPPEAFPPGFFLQHFTGLRRLGEPVKKQESAQTPEGANPSKPDVATPTAEAKAHVKGIHGGYILPFPSFTRPLWPASSHHHPVYVYSHQQPNAYTYGYYY